MPDMPPLIQQQDMQQAAAQGFQSQDPQAQPALFGNAQQLPKMQNAPTPFSAPRQQDMQQLPMQTPGGTPAPRDPMQQIQQNTQPINHVDDLFRHNLYKQVTSPGAVAMRDSFPGTDWTSIDAKANKFSQDMQDRVPTLPFVQQQGSQQAVKTAFAGGNYMDIAASMLGKQEGADHGVLTDFFKKSMGATGNIDPRRVPWCAGFVNSVLQAGGIQGTNSLAARSFLKFGSPVERSDAEKGDIAVFGRGDPSHGHVGFVDHFSEDGKTVYILGGNQSNSVSIHARPASQVLGFRRPPSPEEIQKHSEEYHAKQAAPAPSPASTENYTGMDMNSNKGITGDYGNA